MNKYGCTYKIKRKITAIFLVFAFSLLEISFAATDIPASEKLSPPSGIKPIEVSYRGIKDQITFNMRDRGVVKRGMGEDQRKWDFWKAVEEQSEIYRLSSGDLRVKLHELVDNSYDSIVDKLDDLKVRPENFVAEITIEAILESEHMTLVVTDNGKPITFNPYGTPASRYRDPKKHFGGVNFGTKYIRAGLDDPKRDIRWIPLDAGTQVVVTIPKKNLPRDFVTRTKKKILQEEPHKFANSYTVAAICRAIERYVSLDDQEATNNIYTWATSSPNTDVQITLGAHEVIIDIPGEGLAIRYFDPTQANLVTPYSDVFSLSTRVISSRSYRQIIKREKALPSGLFGTREVIDLEDLLPGLGEHVFPIHIIPEKDRYSDDGVPSLKQVIERVPTNERYLFPDVNADREKFDNIRVIHKAIADAGFIDGAPSLEEVVRRLVEQYPDIEDRANVIMASGVNKKGKKVNLINLLYERAGIKTVQYSLLQHARNEWDVVTALIDGRDNFERAIVGQTLLPEEILREADKHFYDEIRSLKGNTTARNFLAHFLFLHDLGKYVLSEEDHELRSAEILKTVFDGEYFNFSKYEKKLMVRMVALHSAIDRINSDPEIGLEFAELAREAAMDGFFSEQDLKDILKVVTLFRIAELASSGHFAFMYENTFPDLDAVYRTAERIIENAYSQKTRTTSKVAIIVPRSIRGHGETLLNAFNEVGSSSVEVSMEIPEKDETISDFAGRIRKSGYELALVALHGAHNEEPVAFEDFGCDVILLPLRPGEVLLRGRDGTYDIEKWNEMFRKTQAVILLGEARIPDYQRLSNRVMAVPLGFSKIPDSPAGNKHFESGVVIGARTLWSEMRSMYDIKALVREIRKQQGDGSKTFGYIAGRFDEYVHPETKKVVNEFEELRSSPDCLVLEAREIEEAYKKDGGFRDLRSFKQWLSGRLQEKKATVVIVKGDIENEELRTLETSIFDFTNEMYHEIMQGFIPKDEYSAAIHRNAGKSIPIGFDSDAIRDMEKEGIGIIRVKYGEKGPDLAGAVKKIIRYIGNPEEYYARLEATWNAARNYTTRHMGQRYLDVVEELWGVPGKSRSDLVEDHKNYLDANLAGLMPLIGEGSSDTLLRVPVEILGDPGSSQSRIFFEAMNRSQNVHVELYMMSGIGEQLSESIYRAYGIENKDLPGDFKRTRSNTITLFPALKGEEITDLTLRTRLGNMDITPTDTIIIPVGLQNDMAGLVRGTVLGLRVMGFARELAENKTLENDPAFLGRVQLVTMEVFKQVCDSEDRIKLAGFTPHDVISLATGRTINDILNPLRKLVRLLPVTPIDAEELRTIYEHARKVLIAA
jgi:hypothetical protein